MRSTWNLLFYATPDISRYSNETSLMGSIRAGSSTPAGAFHVDFLLNTIIVYIMADISVVFYSFILIELPSVAASFQLSQMEGY